MCKFLKILLIVLVIFNAISCIVLLCVVFPRMVRPYNLGFDYIGVIIAILALLVTLLIGWNIYQLVDFKNKIKEVDKLRVKTERELNYIHNKSDYNHAINYGLMCQSACVHFAPNEENMIKCSMLLHGLAALKILSNFPDTQKEIEKLSNTLIKGLNNSTQIALGEKDKTDILIMFGKIPNKGRIPKYDEMVELVKDIKVSSC